MKIQSNQFWYKAISNVNPIFYKSTSINNPLTTIPQQFLNNSSTNLQRPSLYRAERIFSNNNERSNGHRHRNRWTANSEVSYYMFLLTT